MGPAPAVALLRRAVRTALTRDGAAGTVLIACSGGADSLALAAATAFAAPRAGVRAGLVTVDHGLQDGSADQAARVAILGHELGLDPVVTLRVAVGTAGGPEAAARTARYAALAAEAAALDADVLLGHTLDDQAETVLLGLGRGSGPRSIAGMAGVDGRWVRPLLGLRRADTRAACAALGLEPWDDPHNADPRHRRVRLRSEVLPLLEDVLAGGVAPALARTADLLRDDLDALDAWAASALAAAVTGPAVPAIASTVINSPAAGPQTWYERVDHGKERDGEGAAAALDVSALASLPRAVRTRVLRQWAAAGGAAPLSAERTAALDALLVAWHGQGPVPLPGGVEVRRVSARLELHPRARPLE